MSEYDSDSLGGKVGKDEMMSDADREGSRKSEILWQNNEIQIILPDVQAIPVEEGGHFQIMSTDASTGDWRTDSVKNITREGYYALAAARILADSGRSDNLWANIHWNSRPEFVAGCNVFGRNPQSEQGWGKPVVMREGGVEAVENQQRREDLHRFIQKYLPMWDRAEEEMTLFREGIREVEQGGDEFKAEFQKHIETPPPYQETLLWMNDRFTLVMVNQPHLNGFHLVAAPRPDYWESRGGRFKKAWQTESSIMDTAEHKRGFLELVAVIKTVQVILSSDKSLNFCNPEIHFSGNWAKDLQPKDQGGKVDPDEVLRLSQEEDIVSLRSYKRSTLGEITTGMHGHLYATKSEEDYVELPSRPLAEVPDQWSGIVPPSEEEVRRVQELIKTELTRELEQLTEYKLGE